MTETYLAARLSHRAERGALGRGDDVRQSSLAAFLAFATNPEYLAGMGHRVAALEVSRLLPGGEGDVADALAGL